MKLLLINFWNRNLWIRSVKCLLLWHDDDDWRKLTQTKIRFVIAGNGKLTKNGSLSHIQFEPNSNLHQRKYAVYSIRIHNAERDYAATSLQFTNKTRSDKSYLWSSIYSLYGLRSNIHYDQQFMSEMSHTWTHSRSIAEHTSF